MVANALHHDIKGACTLEKHARCIVGLWKGNIRMHCIRSSGLHILAACQNHVHKTSFPFKSIRSEGNMHYVADRSAAATVQLVTHTLHTCTNTPTCQLTKLGQMYLYTAWTPAKVDSAFGRSVTEQISEAKSPAVFQRHTRVSGSEAKPNTNTRDTRES